MKIKTLGPVKLDGKDIERGTQLDVKNAIGQQLVDANAAELVGKQASTPEPEGNGDGQ
jgi:hypothetical protein